MHNHNDISVTIKREAWASLPAREDQYGGHQQHSRWVGGSATYSAVLSLAGIPRCVCVCVCTCVRACVRASLSLSPSPSLSVSLCLWGILVVNITYLYA